jgi:hypothetical protein
MALIIVKAAPAGSDQANTYDDDMRALKTAIEDIFGIPDNTTIATKLMTVLAAGLQKLHFMDTAADPTVAGDLQRNAAKLLFYDGSTIQELVNASLIPSGHRVIFDNDSAPTDWTRDAAIDDKVIRIVTGVRSDGGTWTVGGLTFGTTGSHVLSIAEMPAHTHPPLVGTFRGTSAGPWGTPGGATAKDSASTGSTGGGGGHTHTGGAVSSDGTWRPLHRDMILCEKD